MFHVLIGSLNFPFSLLCGRSHLDMWCGLLPISHTGATWAQSGSALSPQCGSPPSATFWMLFGLLFDFLHYTTFHTPFLHSSNHLYHWLYWLHIPVSLSSFHVSLIWNSLIGICVHPPFCPFCLGRVVRFHTSAGEQQTKTWMISRTTTTVAWPAVGVDRGWLVSSYWLTDLMDKNITKKEW